MARIIGSRDYKLPNLYEVSPGHCLFDEPLQVKVSGLSPGQEVTLQACVTDEGGETFTSISLYRAQSSGELDLSRSPALEGGSFSGIDPEGPLWSLKSETPFKRLLWKDVKTPLQLKLTLYQGHQPLGPMLAQAVQVRTIFREGVSRILVQEGRLRGSLFLPPGSGPFPAVIDLYGAGGGLMEHRASLLASHGFLTMALAYFGYKDLPKDLVELNLSYFREAVEFLRRHPQVGNQEIGIIGISKGADLAVSMATFLPGIKAVVSISGCHANAFVSLKCDDFILPGWEVDHEKIKFKDSGVCDLFEAMKYPSDPALAVCLIPAERSSAAFLILAGLDDFNWPSVPYSKQLVSRLQEHGKDVEFYYYPGAGHLLEPPYFPVCRASYHKSLGAPVMWGGHTIEHARAQEDAWQKIKIFLSKQLMPCKSIHSRL